MLDVLGGRGVEVQRQRIGEMIARLRDAFTPARDIHLTAQRHIAIALAIDDGRQASVHPLSPVRGPAGVRILQELIEERDTLDT